MFSTETEAGAAAAGAGVASCAGEKRESDDGARHRCWRRLCLGSRGRRRSGALHFQQQNLVALRHLIAELDAQTLDHAALGRRNLHRRLVAFEHHQGIVFLHALSGLDQQFDDLDALGIAQIRYFYAFNWH